MIFHYRKAQVTAESDFRQRLQQARLALGMSRGQEVRQVDVAKMIGMPEARVNRYFRDTIPSLDVIVLLARALEIDPGWLAFGDECKSNAPDWFKPPASGNPGPGGQDPSARAREHLGLAQAARTQPPRGHRRSS